MHALVDCNCQSSNQSQLKQESETDPQTVPKAFKSSSSKTGKENTNLHSNESSSTSPSALGSRLVENQDDAEDNVSTDVTQLVLRVSNGREMTSSRKRRRKDEEDDIEGEYMQRLAAEEEHEAEKELQERNNKRPKLHEKHDKGVDNANEANEGPQTSPSSSPPPQHETIAPKFTSDPSLEQAVRTVFLGNVSTTTITSKPAYNALLMHLSSHISSLPASTPPHKISSFRFRSTPYADSSLPKKAAFAKKDIMDATTKGTNAYAVYSTPLAAREAVKTLNGTVVLGRHLRVDGVAHPSVTDHRRCVFVGNLGFVDDESALRAAEDEESGKKKVRKQKEPADVEEGLWQQFGKAGAVESVRVVRDKTTRVGKGFAYVQFKVWHSIRI